MTFDIVVLKKCLCKQKCRKVLLCNLIPPFLWYVKRCAILSNKNLPSLYQTKWSHSYCRYFTKLTFPKRNKMEEHQKCIKKQINNRCTTCQSFSNVIFWQLDIWQFNNLFCFLKNDLGKQNLCMHMCKNLHLHNFNENVKFVTLI